MHALHVEQFSIHNWIQANAAEHFTSVWMALKDKMEVTITICVGSSIVSTRCGR